MAAPLFTVNAHRHDPYRTFKFQVIIDGKVVAGLRKMGALKKKTEPVKWRASNDPSHERIMPGGTSYDPVTLEQGLTHDPVFEAWASLVNNIEGDAGMSLKNYRKDIVINVLNLQGQVAISHADEPIARVEIEPSAGRGAVDREVVGCRHGSRIARSAALANGGRVGPCASGALDAVQCAVHALNREHQGFLRRLAVQPHVRRHGDFLRQQLAFERLR